MGSKVTKEEQELLIEIDYQTHRDPVILILRQIDPLVARLVCKATLNDHMIDASFKRIQTIFLQNLFQQNSFENIKISQSATLVYWDKKSVAARRVILRDIPNRFNIGWSYMMYGGRRYWISFHMEHRRNPTNPPTFKDGDIVLIYMYYYLNDCHACLF